jgi:hypothetical protein
MNQFLSSIVWGNVPREVTQPWGETSLVQEPWWLPAQAHWHCGIDIGMNIGTPLNAARGGRVVSVGFGQLGIQVGLEVDWYIHIDRAAVATSTLVSRGWRIAYSGAKVPNGGYLTGPHLHFETQSASPPHYNLPGSSIDPVPILTGLFGSARTALEAIAMATLDPNDPIVKQLTGQMATVYSVLTTNSALASTINDIHAQVLAVETTLGALHQGGATDLAPALSAIADVKANIVAAKAVLDATKLQVDKIPAIEANLNAPRPPA